MWRKNHDGRKSQAGNDRTTHEAQTNRLPYPTPKLCTVIVASDGQKTLCDTQNGKVGKHHQALNNTVGRHRQSTAISKQCIVENDGKHGDNALPG